MVEMHIGNLMIVFLIIIIILWLKKPLYMAVGAGIISLIILYQISPSDMYSIIAKGISKWSNISILLVLYCITFLQRILEARNQIMYAYQDLNNIFHSRRINATISALFIGLLPSAAAMILCGDIIKEASEGYLDRKEQAFVTSWFRHIPESSLPTYSGVLLMSGIAGIAVSEYMVGMIIPMIILFLLAYIPYIRKLPKREQVEGQKFSFKMVLSLFQHLWTLFGILFLIIFLKFSVLKAVLLVILLAIFVYRFHGKELRPMFKNAFEIKLLGNTAMVLLLKEFISFTGILAELPMIFADLPIPSYLVFTLLFFVGTLISGTTGTIALIGPIAFATVPDAGLPLMILLMSVCHVANQISPTHICLVVATEYFGVTLGDLIKKTLPILILFCLIIIGYYNILLIM